MKIAKYVGELLYDYECVVIPGLGGFIAEDQSVVINKVTDKFLPPYRKVHFNIHLRANDGLLVNYVAQKEQIGYSTAKQRVDKFVFLCQNALESGKKINFNHIGSIAYNDEKNIVFHQDKNINYNADSFGLGPLVSLSIRRVSDEEKVKKVVKSAIDKSKERTKTPSRHDKNVKKTKAAGGRKMEANRRKSSFTNQLIFLAVVIFAMGISYMYMRRDAMSYYYDRYAAHVPFFYSSVNDYLATNINSTPVAKLSRSTASLFPVVLDDNSEAISDITIIEDKTTYKDNSETDIPIVEKASILDKESVVIKENIIPSKKIEDIIEPIETDSKEIEITTKVVDKPVNYSSTASDKYFIIAGSFSNESNAKRLVSDLKSQGYKALIADTNKYGMYRVAFMSFNNRTIANKELVAIKRDSNSKAWLLVK